jgi:hypothetical protein
MQNFATKKTDLERDFATAIYLPEAPSPPRLFVLGWSSNFVGSEFGQMHSVKLLQYMPSITSPLPPPPPVIHCLYTVYRSVHRRERVLLAQKEE